MTDVAKEAFASRNYRLAVEMYERCLKQQSPNIELLFGYGDSLARCGRIREAIDVYSRCLALGNVPPDKLRHLANAMLEDLGVRPCGSKQQPAPSFACPACEGAMYLPVTLYCGHTFCRACLEDACRLCGQQQQHPPETNVLVRRLVEKWWPREAEASAARHEADALLKKGLLGQALDRYDLAVQLVPNSPLHLCNRAHALLLLNRPQASLADADHAVRLRPDWAKGHYQRGLALSVLMRNEEALVALCTSAAIDKNPQAIRHELTRVLHRVLLNNVRRQSSASFRTPYDLAEARMRRNRHHILLPLMSSNHRQRRNTSVSVGGVGSGNAFNTSDCEDNSSGGEEEFSQSICRRLLSSTTPQDNSKLYATLDRLYQEVDKLNRLESRPAEMLLPPANGGTAASDLECILCCRLLWRPVTTPCGHTYCWVCLDRCLDYSSACPLCVTSLADYLASSQKTVTEFVERALKCAAPKEYAARAAGYRHEFVQPELGPMASLSACSGPSSTAENIAVFICTTSFPCVACPLFVYEPRYRLMVRRCLESGVRRFGITASTNRGAVGHKRYAEYGTMLEIRDRVLLKDGCSILSTVGASRFRVLSGGERDGYDTAQVELLRDAPIPPERTLGLAELHNKVRAKSRRWWTTVAASQRSEIRRVFGEMPELEDDWLRLADGPSWAWWLLAILPLSPQLQIGILGTTSLEKRLRAIDKTLEHMEQRQLSVAPTTTATTTITTTTSSSSSSSSSSSCPSSQPQTSGSSGGSDACRDAPESSGASSRSSIGPPTSASNPMTLLQSS